MWFDDEDVFGRRLKRRGNRSRKRAVLTLNARSKVQKSERMHRVAVFVLVPAVLVAFGLVLWHGTRLAWRALVSENPRFTITTLEIKGDPVITRDFIVGKKGIDRGANLFGFSIREVREDFLRGAPNFKSMEISRRLPGTLRVEAIERTPLARLGRRRGLLVDGEGVVFGHRARKDFLPAIHGYDGPPHRPGQRVSGLTRDAILVLDLCERNGIDRELPIVEIDVSGVFGARRDALQLTVGRGTVVDLWWHRGGTKGASGLEDLQGRLLYLCAVWKRAQQENRPLRTVNLTLDTYVDNCPITPRWE